MRKSRRKIAGVSVLRMGNESMVKNFIEKTGDSGIMRETNDKGKTDVQIQHIMEHHPNDFERFSKYFSNIVAEPDYIIRGNKPNTAVILKEIFDNGERFQTILRLCTSKEPEGFKNSIITFMKIDEKRWKRYLRTKEILYRRE